MKNRIIWYMIGLILLCTSVKGHAQGIDFFEGTFEDALVKAKESNKLVFVDINVDETEHVYPMQVRGGAMNEMILSKPQEENE